MAREVLHRKGGEEFDRRRCHDGPYIGPGAHEIAGELRGLVGCNTAADTEEKVEAMLILFGHSILKKRGEVVLHGTALRPVTEIDDRAEAPVPNYSHISGNIRRFGPKIKKPLHLIAMACRFFREISGVFAGAFLLQQ